MIRRHTTLGWAVALALAGCTAPGAAPDHAWPPAAGPAASALAARIDSIVAPIGGVFSVAAVHPRSGRNFSRRPAEPVFMSSVVKLPLAVAVFRMADRGELDLDASVQLAPGDYAPGMSAIAEEHPQGVRLTVRELLRAAVSASDNSAADRLLALAGGPAAVGAELRMLGFPGVRVDRSYRELSADFNGVSGLPAGWTLAQFEQARSGLADRERRAAADRFLASPLNTARAQEIASLLVELRQGVLMSPAATEELLRMMTETENPATRIVAGVPAGVRVAHKTGTWGGAGVSVAVNDVGLVDLPAPGEYFAVAILVKGAARPTAEVEAAIAAVSRELYAHFAAAAR